MSSKLENQHQALSWLKELRLDHNPQFINQVKINILAKCSNVEEVEFVLIKARSEVLVYCEIGWLTKKLEYRKRYIVESILEIIEFFLPTYRARVVFDREILVQTIKLLEEYKDIYDL